jgi:short-subunit dehydrogenase
MNMLVIGASAGLGSALSESLARAGHNLILVASDDRDLDVLAADLRLRFGIRVQTVACRIAPGADYLPPICAAAGRFDAIDGLFYPIGLSDDDDRGLLDDAKSRAILEANFYGLTLITAHFLPAMIERKSGYVVGFGSVAAVRGRGANVIYSASKRALASYFESVRHLTNAANVRVQFYQLGYLDTQQAYGKKLLFPKADPHKLADVVVRSLRRDFGVRYYPGFWWMIVAILRALPWPVFRRVRF